jgi:magnesium chelatase subunit D
VSVAFPLSAVVGQEELVESLLVNAVAPDVGGVLLRGERGSAKSTAVRGLASLLPPVRAAASQTYAFAPGELGPDGPVGAEEPVEERPAPLVELPLGATLDRLLGALHLGRALAGEAVFEPGLLARAHRGILYVDEVNLLPDHLVDALLDAAASGVARVERDAVSVEHAARFVLVGTMNVEEGELRPQLLDRFGLGVEARATRDPAQRAEIVRRRLEFERDPRGFAARWREQEQALAARIAVARERLPAVRLPERELLRITGACARLGVDGVRGDIVCARAACALAAFEGAEEASEEHVLRAARLALAHRRRRDPLDPTVSEERELERAFGEEGEPPEHDPRDGGDGGGDGSDGDGSGGDGSGGGAGGGGARSRRGAAGGAGQRSQETPARQQQVASTGAAQGPPSASGGDEDERRSCDPQARAGERRPVPLPASLPARAIALAGAGGGPAGRRASSVGPGAGAIDSRPALAAVSEDVALVATLHARLAGAAPEQVREHVRAGREGALLCLIVDASGSMGARRRLGRVKGALLELLRDGYARRDRIAVVCFHAERARVLVAPGAPLERAAEAIRALPAGGRTPLAEGLRLAAEVLERERHRERHRRSIAAIFTDGRASDRDGAVRAAALQLGRVADAVHVVDTEEGPVRLGLARALAAAAGASVHELGQARKKERRAA